MDVPELIAWLSKTLQGDPSGRMATDVLRQIANLATGVVLDSDLDKIEAYLMATTPPIDVRVDQLALLVRMRLKLGQASAAIARLSLATIYFDAAGAFSASARAFAEAEEIARNEHLGAELIALWEDRAISLSEQGKHEEGLKILARTEVYCTKLGLDFPGSLRLNVANLNVRLGRYETALDAFEELDQSQLSDTERFVSLTNTAICYLRLDDPTSAFWASEEALRLLHDGCDYSLTDYIELLFVKTAVYAAEACEDWVESISDLVDALDELLSEAERLHYRRGVREKYARRLAKLLRDLPTSGPSANVLGPLLWQAGNSTTDWLSLLQWADEGRQVVHSNLGDCLATAIDNVAILGAPILYGFREKYDDPFEPSGLDGGPNSGADQFRRAWNDLFVPIGEVKKLVGGIGPYEAVSVRSLSKHYSESLRSGIAYLFSIVHPEGYWLFLLSGEGYSRIDLPSEPFKSMRTGIYLSRHKRSDTGLHEAVEASAERLSESLGELMQNVASKSSRLVILPDRLSESLPFLGAMLKNDALRAMMLDEGFSISTAMATFPTPKAGPVAVTKALILIDPPANLDLAVDEADMIGRCFPKAVVDRHSTSISSANAILTSDADLIHIAAHGSAVTNFSDPWFADFLEVEGFGLSDFQSRAHRLRHELVFLNACHGGVTASTNAFATFVSREAMGFVSLALLNRKSTAVAPAWAVHSIAAYIFAKIFYKSVASGMGPESALSVAAAQMYNMSGDTASTVASDLSDRRLAARYSEAFKGIEYPFRSTWDCGAYRCFVNG